MILTNEAQQAFTQDTIKRWPHESCGLVIANAYHACDNTHPEPTKYFRIEPQQRIDLECIFGTVQAVLHSHPYELMQSRQFYQAKYNPAWPSVPDQQGFIDDTADWGIVASDGQGISDFVWLSQSPVPMDKRQFSWFASDCYAIVRDWFALNTDTRLPNFTRDWEFWKKGINTIGDGIQTIPFAKVHATVHAKIGDAVAFQLGGSPVVNHLGVICGENEMLHIFPDKGYYAHTTRWDRWAPRARYCIRFNE